MEPLSAARRIAGLLGYNPGPGLYSRMTRAVEGMPAVIRTQELPGLLRKYPEGVPGWEVASVAPALEGVQSIPRQDLLDLIQQHSPAYTHREVILGGRPQRADAGPFLAEVRRATGYDADTNAPTGEEWVGSPAEGSVPLVQQQPMPLGLAVSHGGTQYREYGQGGQDYAELLLQQPGADGALYGSHWTPSYSLTKPTVAHARYDIHGDALRINELQSDLGIHNRKVRERAGQPQGPLGWDNTATPSGAATELPFPLEDAWADILIKRLALEAARGGHRAIEIASPRAIADKVGGNIDNYEHFYGKVVPGALERLGRKMGGVTADAAGAKRLSYDDILSELWRQGPDEVAAANAFDRLLAMENSLSERFPSGQRAFGRLGIGETVGRVVSDSPWDPTLTNREAMHIRDVLWGDLERAGHSPEDAERLANQRVGEVLHDAAKMKELANQHYTMSRYLERRAQALGQNEQRTSPPGRRYLMSDEMRKRILEGGIGLSVLGGLSAQEE